jgi:RNA-directed DNA polymerase
MTKPTISLQELRTRIGNRAKSAPTHRFWGMHVHLTKLETLEAAYLEARRNGGAPGADGVTFEDIESKGRCQFIAELAEELREDRYAPGPYRRREIPKEGGKVRTISIPSIRDRVFQGALRLLLEPIFEADFSPHSYGARPGRSAHQAVDEVRKGMNHQKQLAVDVDLKAFFDTIRHDRMMEKVARRVQDGRVLALVKQFLKSTGERGIPQGSPLSPLLANVALTDLDYALGKGKGYLTYVRYLDDMVVLTFNSKRGWRWAERALGRIREEAEAIGVELNKEKTRTVLLTEKGAMFAFLGFEFRWKPKSATAKAYAHTSPRKKKLTEVLRKVRDTLRRSQHLPVQEAVAQVNPILRGWVNYFRVGNSSRAFDKVKFHVERKVRRFAVKKLKRKGFGWTRWSSDVVYKMWGLFNDYRIRYYAGAKAGALPKGIITPVR